MHLFGRRKGYVLTRKTVAGMMAASIMTTCMVMAGSALATSSGSWGQIKQKIDKPEGWVRVVEKSDFQLGETREIGEAGGKPLLEVAFGTYPSIDGSTVAVPMAMEFARQHLDLPEEDLEGFVYFSTTHGAYMRLIQKQPNGATMIGSMNATMEANHPVDILIATEPSDEELALAVENGVALLTKPVCYDAFVFITHKNNPVDSLTVAQIQQIYSGRIVNWKEVGGDDGRIYAYQREANSGSQTAMENMVMQGKPMDAAEDIELVYSEMSGLVYRIGTYDNDTSSIGYTYQYYIDMLYPNEDIKVLKIDGIAPTQENLHSGAYPFTTCYYGVIRAEDTQGIPGQFLSWMVSEEGQRAVAQAGYVPMMEAE